MGNGFPRNTYRVNSVTVGATVQFTERVSLRVFDNYEIGASPIGTMPASIRGWPWAILCTPTAVRKAIARTLSGHGECKVVSCAHES